MKLKSIMPQKNFKKFYNNNLIKKNTNKLKKFIRQIFYINKN